MHRIVWQYRVAPEHVNAFEAAYRSGGTWSQLFRRSPDYLGTELYRSTDAGNVYVTIDRWRTKESWERFRSDHSDAYRALDAECDALTESETLVASDDRT
jgi:heme-degrading monooxygenase HmoA